ncbi:MAG: protoheme IX farnesyltransferase [bacterium]|nr:protoheme IX farnesyltransferase [bacterium]
MTDQAPKQTATGPLRLLSLTKPRIFLAIAMTAWVGLLLQKDFLAYGQWASWIVIISTIMASAGGAVFNHYFERETDQLMNRTKHRLLVSSDPLMLRQSLGFGAFLSLGGIGLCWWLLGWVSALWLFMGFFTYVVIYTLIFKHHSLWNVTVGSLSSPFAILAGNTAITGEVTLPGAIMAVHSFFWNPVHFWNLNAFYQEDYEQAGIPMLPPVIGANNTIWLIIGHALAVLAASVALWHYSELGTLYLVGSTLLGLILLGMNIQNLGKADERLFRRNFIFSNIYLLLLYLVIIADMVATNYHP